MIDENLKKYATKKQWEYYLLAEELGSCRKASKELGFNSGVVSKTIRVLKRKAAKYGYAPENDFTKTVPDGFEIKGVSTYYDKDGKVRSQWVKSQVDKELQEEIMREAISAFVDEIPRVREVKSPKGSNSNLMTVYPVGDHHFGMLAWDKESDADYDLEIAGKLLLGSMDYLVESSPKSEEAAVVLLGDFMHYDGYEPVTPTSRNILDADSRFPKMVKVAIQSIRHLVLRALQKHQKVRLIIEVGNHDLSSSIFLMEAMKIYYESEPRVFVDNTPKQMHSFVFGKNLVVTHHGHSIKMNELASVIACDYAKEWGEALHRYCYTGHLHHDHKKEFRGITVEQMRVLAPKDAYAQHHGYRAGRDMKAIVLHKEFGEVSRNLVTPEMLKENSGEKE